MARRRLAGLGAVALVAAALTGSGAVRPSPSPLAPVAARLATQQVDTPTMQPVNLPARPVRVAVVPGTGGQKAWAIGYSTAIHGGWNSGGLGQAVFMYYTRDTGWQIAGPPRLPSGQASPARLSSLAIAPNGDGWAVGAGGVIFHHSSGTMTWEVATSPTTQPLTSVSLTPDGSAGYAVGPGFTVIRLKSGSSMWETDTALNLGPPSLDLISVAAVDDANAWAVSGDTSQQLYILHRTGGNWSRVTTGDAQFDTPSGAGGNQAANGEAIAASGSGVWVVGRMQPADAGHPLGDATAGDRSRPFAISIQSGTVRSYCPGIMSVTTSGGAAEQNVCGNPFPLGAFGLTGIVGFGDPSSGEAFASGMGLFHFVNGRWQREPDSVGYLSSLSLDSPQEGWMTGTGSNAITGAALSESMVIGHWTREVGVPAMARWPEPDQAPLEGAALAPNGSGVVLAVGTDGHHDRYVPGFGWDVLPQGSASLHALSWPAMNSAWAVGSDATLAHWDGHAWTESSAPRNHQLDPMSALYGVAFADAGHGWAVGEQGVLLDYDNGWHRDALSNSDKLTTQPLFAVAYGGGSAVAGGAGGTVLVARGSSWAVDQNASSLAMQGSASASTIYAAASLPDGTVALGGTGGLLLIRPPGGAFFRVEPSVDGTIVALGLSHDSGDLVVAASVSPRTATKYLNGALATTDGYLFTGRLDMAHASATWRDIELNHQLTMWTSTDTAAAHDPVYALALEPGTLRGWAVGGYPAFTLDDDNQSSERGTATGSVYRVDLNGDPSPPSSQIQLPDPPSSGFTFAFLGDSSCAAGVCGAALGSGPMADSVLQEAKREIDMVQPDLTFFGGNMRGLGRSQELDTFRRMMGMSQSSSTPMFAAMGWQDRVSALNPNDVVPAAPSQSLATTNVPYLTTFAGQDSPWGNGGAHQDKVHATARTSGEGAPAGNEATTHYAFDYQSPGLPPQVRFIVVNDSVTTAQGTNTLADPNENPSFTGAQLQWLQGELSDARAHHLQSIVIMSAPSQDPRIGSTTTTLVEGKAFDAAVSAPGSAASAVFASQINDNIVATLSPVVPVKEYISGGAGSPLDGTRNSLQGYYHSWLLVTVDPDHPTPNGLATVTVKSMPVIESVAMRLGNGSTPGTVLAGSAIQVYSIGRLPDAGLPNINGGAADQTQSKAQYLQFPPLGYGSYGCVLAEAENCTVGYANPPAHRFWVENPDPTYPIAAFVQPCPNAYTPYSPCIDSSGHLVPDDQSGYLCALHPGKVWIDVLMGIRVARQQIDVTSGSGSCGEHQLPPLQEGTSAGIVQHPAPGPAAQSQSVVVPGVPPVQVPAHRPHLYHVVNGQLVPAVMPPPVPVLAAAPPLPAAGTAAKKEEEREKALEHSKENSGHQAVIRADADAYWDPRPAAAAGAAALMFLIGLSAWAVGRREPRAAFDERRWE
jgi:hypothetical protein